AALLRNYGTVLYAQTPLLELRKLDPYNPTDAALIRNLGGMPLWGWWGPWYQPAPMSPLSVTLPTPAVEVQPAPAELPSQPAPFMSDEEEGGAISSPARRGAMVTLLRPQTNDGIWISYEGRRWVSAGRAVSYGESTFVRVGQYAGFPVFKQRTGADDVIY